MQLYSPWALLLLLILPILAYLALRKERTAAVKFPSLVELRNCHLSWRIRLRPFLKVRRIAAIIIVAFCLGYIAYDLLHPTMSSSPRIELADIDDALAEREKAYQVQIRMKQEELRASGTVEYYIISELIEEIERLDTIYDQAMADLTELGYDEQIIHTIFDTYEKKIQLLELIILETNKIQSHENEPHRVYL